MALARVRAPTSAEIVRALDRAFARGGVPARLLALGRLVDRAGPEHDRSMPLRFARSVAVVSLLVACEGGAAPAGDAGPGGGDAGAGRSDAGPPVAREVPRAVSIARTTEIPDCTLHVDAASGGGDGSAASPFATIAQAVAVAGDGAVVCVAEGVYRETVSPGARALTLAGGFQSGSGFAVRDSSVYVSRAQGDGTGDFVRIEGEDAPRDDALTAIDGFEITGYERGVARVTYFSQRFDLTNNHIHDNHCPSGPEFGGGFLLVNVSGTIAGNVIEDNTCGFGGGGVVLDETSLASSVLIERNRFEGNAGEDADCHGGGLYLRVTEAAVRGNDFLENRCAGWGAGLYVGAEPPQRTTARMDWNVYRGNRADLVGGGLFCDDSATCVSDHDIFDGNCGGNVFVDSGNDPAVPTLASFDHMTNRRALDVGCAAPGAGFVVNKENDALDAYTITSSIFWENDEDVAAFCDSGCAALTITVTYSALDLATAGNASVTFGDGNLDRADPRFVAPDAGDLHLRSTSGHWSPGGYVEDSEDSPALAAGDPSADTSGQPVRAGARSEMGAYGNSAEASYVR